MTEPTVLTETKEHIGTITLNRPEHNNTFNPQLARELGEALAALEHSPQARVVIIRGAGRNFSTGISLDEFKNKTPQAYREFLTLMDMHNHILAKMSKPVIASVQGYAVANGAGLVCACDLAVAAEDAKIGTTAINVGLICLGPAVPLSRILGRKRALEMLLTGRMLSASEAERLGLLNRVVPREDLDKATRELASELAAKSPLALQAGKRGFYALEDLPYHEAVDAMTEIFAELCVCEDAEEGVRAFLEKRAPEWKLR
jgi:enoyl-CoA hydratase/carnithine racemase